MRYPAAVKLWYMQGYLTGHLGRPHFQFQRAARSGAGGFCWHRVGAWDTMDSVTG